MAEDICGEIETLQSQLIELRGKRDLQLELLNEERTRRTELYSRKTSLFREIEVVENQIQDLEVSARNILKIYVFHPRTYTGRK